METRTRQRKPAVQNGVPLCPDCDEHHHAHEPHCHGSEAWMISFCDQHGRYPTFADAVAHCTPEVGRLYRRILVAAIRQRGLPVPKDLLEWDG